MVGVPMDTSAPLYAGTRHGPEAVRKWSHNQGPVHNVTRTIPFDTCNIVDMGDVKFTDINHMGRLDDIYNTFKEIFDKDIVPLTVGGEHTMTYPILKARGSDDPVGLIHIDAHCDTTGSLGDDSTEVHDGNCFRVAACEGLIDPERTIQIGIRGASTVLWEFSHASGMRVVSAEEFQERGVQEIIKEARKIIGDGPCYLTLDVDGIDPTDMPGTGVPEPFGLTGREVRDFIRGMSGLNLVGADIAEICPARDPTEISANLGAGLMFEMLCLLSDARSERTGKIKQTSWK
jgi:agmatinase